MRHQTLQRTHTALSVSALWLLPSLLLIAGCSSVTVHTEHDDRVDLGSYRSFAWIEPDHEGEHPSRTTLLIERRLKREIIELLTSRGYSEAEPQQADMLVCVLTTSHDRVKVTNHLQSLRHVQRYEVGTLLIDIVDRSSGEPVWRGVIKRSDPESSLSREEVRVIVGDVFAEFPP